MRIHLDQPQSHRVRTRGHHAALAVRSGPCDAAQVGRPEHRRRDPRAARPRRRSRPATSSASAFTLATRCAATKWAGCVASGGRTSSTAASTQRLYPEEALERGAAHAAVKGDGDGIWPQVLDDVAAGRQERIYEGGRVPGASLQKARWDLMPRDRYMWASVQTVRGCPKHCSFCSVWRTDGQEPRQRTVDAVLEEIVQLRRMGFRFIALADDNFYPVTLEDLAMARRRKDPSRLHELEALREERFELMERLAKLPRRTRSSSRRSRWRRPRIRRFSTPCATRASAAP